MIQFNVKFKNKCIYLLKLIGSWLNITIPAFNNLKYFPFV